MVSELEEMPEEQLQGYVQYARQNMLPTQRQEFYFAQLSNVIAASNGADCKITDFLLNYKVPEVAQEVDKKPIKAPNPFFAKRQR